MHSTVSGKDFGDICITLSIRASAFGVERFVLSASVRSSGALNSAALSALNVFVLLVFFYPLIQSVELHRPPPFPCVEHPPFFALNSLFFRPAQGEVLDEMVRTLVMELGAWSVVMCSLSVFS